MWARYAACARCSCRVGVMRGASAACHGGLGVQDLQHVRISVYSEGHINMSRLSEQVHPVVGVPPFSPPQTCALGRGGSRTPPSDVRMLSVGQGGWRAICGRSGAECSLLA